MPAPLYALGTTFLTLGLLAFLGSGDSTPFTGTSVLFVIPAGAFMSGLAATSGFIWSSSRDGVRPRNWTVWLAIALAIGVFAADRLFDFSYHATNGASLWSWYLDVTRHRHLVMMRGSAVTWRFGEMGGVGFLREAWLLAGAVLGGLLGWATAHVTDRKIRRGTRYEA